MDQNLLAKNIYTIIGPASNIKRINNCMTRLRVYLKHQDAAMISKLKAVDGVLGIHENDEELQIILGPGRAAAVTTIVTKLWKQDADVTTTDPAQKSRPRIGDGKELHAAIRKKNATPIKLLFKKIASIFLPLVPAFIACGLITGFLNILLKADPAAADMAIVKMLAVMGNAVFFGMNLFVGVNASKEFGGSPILGGVLAAILTHPALANVILWDAPLTPGRGGIIAVLLVAAFAAWLEKKLHRIIPEMFDLFFTPLLVILISGSIAIFILQPVGGVISEAIGAAATVSIGQGGAFTGFILGGIWLPMVMLGLHQVFTPIHAELFVRYGVNILLPVLAMAGAGQVGAAVAVYFKTKNAFLKKTIASALPVGIMGIGEPLLYGVTLPLGRPFIGACIGGAFGGAVQASAVVGVSTMGISGLPLAAVSNNIPVYLMGVVVAYVAGFIATWLIGFEDPEDEE